MSLYRTSVIRTKKIYDGSICFFSSTFFRYTFSASRSTSFYPRQNGPHRLKGFFSFRLFRTSKEERKKKSEKVKKKTNGKRDFTFPPPLPLAHVFARNHHRFFIIPSLPFISPRITNHGLHSNSVVGLYVCLHYFFSSIKIKHT